MSSPYLGVRRSKQLEFVQSVRAKSQSPEELPIEELPIEELGVKLDGHFSGPPMGLPLYLCGIRNALPIPPHPDSRFVIVPLNDQKRIFRTMTRQQLQDFQRSNATRLASR